MGYLARQLAGRTDPALDAGWEEPPSRKGFFTDTSICIGCKACEVACKEWNALPMDGSLDLTGDSYDNTGDLGASTWRHVAFVEQSKDRIEAARESGRRLVDLGMPTVGSPSASPDPSTGGSAEPRQKEGDDLRNPAKNGGDDLRNPAKNGGIPAGYGTLPAPPEHGGPSLGDLLTEKAAVDNGADPLSAGGGLGTTVDGTPMVGPLPEFRWLMASDVCKHCTHAGCLDVCPTGALFRSEHGTVVVQDDICNGCGYCVGACPFGVIERRTDSAVSVKADGHVPNVGVAQKCTLCYDRLSHDQTPACAQTCPTTSIQFGAREDMVTAAQERVVQLHDQGFTEARLYGANDQDGVGGTGSVFLLLDEPEVYGLPPDPVCATSKLAEMFRAAGWAGTGLLAAGALAFLGGRR